MALKVCGCTAPSTSAALCLSVCVSVCVCVCVCFSCIWLHYVPSLMWHYLFCCRWNGPSFVWTGAITLRPTHMDAHTLLSYTHSNTHTERVWINYWFKSHLLVLFWKQPRLQLRSILTLNIIGQKVMDEKQDGRGSVVYTEDSAPHVETMN